MWSPHGTPMQMISTAISTHVGWLAEHGHLYRHLTMHALSARVGSKDAITDVKAAIAGHLTELFRQVLHELGGSEPVAEPLAHGIVGLVESTTDRWLDAPERMDRDQLTELLTRWVWRLLDDALRPLGLTTLQYTALTVLRAQGELSSAQLARRSFLRPQTMHEMVLALEKRGLITRGPDERNRRVLLARLTDEGRALLERAAPAVHELEEALLDGLSPGQRETFREGLGHGISVLAQLSEARRS